MQIVYWIKESFIEKRRRDTKKFEEEKRKEVRSRKTKSWQRTRSKN